MHIHVKVDENGFGRIKQIHKKKKRCLNLSIWDDLLEIAIFPIHSVEVPFT